MNLSHFFIIIEFSHRLFKFYSHVNLEKMRVKYSHHFDYSYNRHIRFDGQSIHFSYWKRFCKMYTCTYKIIDCKVRRFFLPILSLLTCVLLYETKYGVCSPSHECISFHRIGMKTVVLQCEFWCGTQVFSFQESLCRTFININVSLFSKKSCSFILTIRI